VAETVNNASYIPLIALKVVRMTIHSNMIFELQGIKKKSTNKGNR
jgi:hypothetical protein